MTALIGLTGSGCSSSRNLLQINHQVGGAVIDYTANHGVDRRIWSPSLCQRRDLYVYLPPGYDPKKRYPLIIWMHGIIQDEWSFIDIGLPRIDAMIRKGRLPPCIIAVPDGTQRGQGGYFSTHSGFLNSKLGRYEDYVMCDVWNFVVKRYPIRPEPKAHVLAGVSMGGGAAFHHAIKHRHRFGIVFGIYPPLNTRWMDCRGRYFGDFHPNCWGWRNSVVRGNEPVGIYYGIFRIPIRNLVYPLFGRGPEAVRQMSLHNPIEMLDTCRVRPGELSMFVAYGGQDEFNMDAQIESFLFRAKQKGLRVAVRYNPHGRHQIDTAVQFMDSVIDWLAPQLAPFQDE